MATGVENGGTLIWKVSFSGKPYDSTSRFITLAERFAVATSGDTRDFISLKLQRLSDDQLRQEFCDSDFIFVPYSKILTSGICINALSHGRPFIAPNFPSLLELHREGHSYLYETQDALSNELLKYNSYYHRGLLPLLFDPNKIISESSFLEWPNIFSNLSHDLFL